MHGQLNVKLYKYSINIKISSDFLYDFLTFDSNNTILLLLLLSVGLPVANALDVLQPCGLLYYPGCSNCPHQSSSKRSWQSELELNLIILDVPTFTTSRLPRDPSNQRWNYVGEKWPMNFA